MSIVAASHLQVRAASVRALQSTVLLSAVGIARNCATTATWITLIRESAACKKQSQR